MTTTLAQHSVALSRLRHLSDRARALRVEADMLERRASAIVPEAFPVGCVVTSVARRDPSQRHTVTGHHADGRVCLVPIGSTDGHVAEWCNLTRVS